MAPEVRRRGQGVGLPGTQCSARLRRGPLGFDLEAGHVGVQAVDDQRSQADADPILEVGDRFDQLVDRGLLGQGDQHDLAAGRVGEQFHHVAGLGVDGPHVHAVEQGAGGPEEADGVTGGRGVDHVLEVGGAETLERSLRAVRFGGRVSLIGNLSGLDARLNLALVFMRAVRLQGILVGSREMFEAMNRAIDRHRLQPVIDRVFDFEELPEAFDQIKKQGHFGKIVVRVP